MLIHFSMGTSGSPVAEHNLQHNNQDCCHDFLSFFFSQRLKGPTPHWSKSCQCNPLQTKQTLNYSLTAQRPHSSRPWGSSAEWGHHNNLSSTKHFRCQDDISLRKHHVFSGWKKTEMCSCKTRLHKHFSGFWDFVLGCQCPGELTFKKNNPPAMRGLRHDKTGVRRLLNRRKPRKFMVLVIFFVTIYIICLLSLCITSITD